MLKTPLVAKGRKCGSESGESASRFPQPIELGVDPAQRSFPRPLDPLPDTAERSRTGHERTDRAVMGQQFRSIGKRIEVLVRGKGYKLLRVDPAPLCSKFKHLLVRKQESVHKPGSDRVADVALPQDAAKRRVLHAEGVLRFFAHREHTTHPNYHAPRLLRKRRALGVEETERLIAAQRAEEGIEERQLVIPLLYPIGFDFLAALIVDFWFTIRHPSKLHVFCKSYVSPFWVSFDFFSEHPSEWHTGSCVLWLHEVGLFEVPVGGLIGFNIWMRHRPR